MRTTTLDDSRGGRPRRARAGRPLRGSVSGLRDDGCPAGEPEAGGFHGPRVLLPRLQGRLGAGQGACGHDALGPGPTGLDLQAAPSSAAAQPGGGVQNAVAERLRLGAGQGAVQGKQPEPGQHGGGGQGGGLPRLVHRQRGGGVLADAAVFPGADGIFDPGMDPLSGVDVGILAQPALGVCGPVRSPQGVPPAVVGLEQRELSSRVGGARGGRRPASSRATFELVSGRAAAQQRRQFGDVRLFDPAPAVPAAQVAARRIGAALADLAVGIDRDLPGPVGTAAIAARSAPSSQPTE